MSKSLFAASTPLVEKMVIYHHKDKLWGIYNLTGAFLGDDYMEDFIRDEIIITQPS